MSKDDDLNMEERLAIQRAAYEAKKQHLPDEARRALAEAEIRRAEQTSATERPAEYHGQKGLEPTRYGDWEKKGIISDF